MPDEDDYIEKELHEENTIDYNKKNSAIINISDFIDHYTFNKIINKLTDYSEIITEGKLAGFINFEYRLNRSQTNKIIDLLLNIQALSKIFNLALKGSKDLEPEYISNIFSETMLPNNMSSYTNIRNIVENRLSHQAQQYNINMGKNNTTVAIPLDELRGHVKTYLDLREQNVTISTKAQHGIIAATLHDAYVILLNRPDFWNDKTYMKFFFNEDDIRMRHQLLLTKKSRLSLDKINDSVKEILDHLSNIIIKKSNPVKKQNDHEEIKEKISNQKPAKLPTFNDKMLLTPFGKQYGSKIDTIIYNIFSEEKKDQFTNMTDDIIKEKIIPLYQLFKNASDITEYKSDIFTIVEYCFAQTYGVKPFVEKFLYINKKDIFSKFYSGSTKDTIDLFINQLFTIYFELQFSSLFRIIKSLDMKKFACAYIIKRIYLSQGDNLSTFGFYFIRTIAKIGGIKTQ